MSRPLAVIVNPVAGGGRALPAYRKAVAALRRLGAEPGVVEATSADHARETARIAAAEGKTVVAVGGDGLVGSLAGVVRDTEGALALIPAGRGNDFARILKIPDDPEAAARLVLEGEDRLLDVGEVDGRPFVGIASLGLDSDANRIANEARVLKGNLVYLYAGLRALAGWKHASFEVTVDGERHPVRGYSVAVANSRAYGGGMLLAPHAELDDGMLDVQMVHEQSKLACLRDLAKVFRGTHLSNERIKIARGAVIEVSADRPFTVYADGDPIADLPVTMSVRTRSLRVLTPPAA